MIAVIIGILVSLVVMIVGTPLLIRLVHRLHYGQYIRQDGPQSHQVKRGTPTLGGVVINLAIVLGWLASAIYRLVVFGHPISMSAVLVLFAMVSMGILGFIDDFAKVKFVTAKVLACEAVPKSAKLLRFTLDCGEEFPRQILSGIHEWYEPEDLVGKTVVACTNLKPRKMMGIMSNGMLISAVKEEPDGSEKLHLVILDDKVPAGYGLC